MFYWRALLYKKDFPNIDYDLFYLMTYDHDLVKSIVLYSSDQITNRVTSFMNSHMSMTYLFQITLQISAREVMIIIRCVILIIVNRILMNDVLEILISL